MADSPAPTMPRQVDAITAPARPAETKPTFAAPQVPAQAAKKHHGRRKWIVRGIIIMIMLLPFIALAVAAGVIYRTYQPQALHRTPITPVAPATAPKS